jgi:hypothetical protein
MRVGSWLSIAWGIAAVIGLGCAADPPARRPPPLRPKIAVAAPKPADASSPPPVSPPAPASPQRVVRIKGLTGTLNVDDVHQTMDAQRRELDACIGESRRSLRWVSGSIRFAFVVDAEGHVKDVHPLESSIGHSRLERCIADILAATTFPEPAGHADARFTWGMSVEPAGGRPPDALDAKLVQPLLKRKARDLLRTCEVRRRERFQITAYIARGGRVLSAGAVPMPPKASERLDCVLEEIAHWPMPKVDRQAKVSFLLR